MQISKKKTYKILAYCAMSAILLNGGVASAEDDSNNEVSVTSSSITRNGTSENYDGTITEDFYGGETSDGNSDNNNITINGGTFNRYLSGGLSRANGNSNNNRVTIFGGTFNSWVEGGWAYVGNANYNTLSISDGIFSGQYVEGGYAITGDANYNTVIVNGGTFGSSTLIDGGWATVGNANYNTVTINGGTINGPVYGGYVSGSGDAIGNVININGGVFSGNIYSGTGTTVRDNVINIRNSPNLSNASIYAARGGTSANNSINIYTKDITAQTIGGFENLNFYLPSDAGNGSTILTLTNPSGTISNNINVYRNGGEMLNPGDKITLLTTPSSGGLSFGNYTAQGLVSQGISFDYPINIGTVTNGSGIVTGLEATVGEYERVLKPQTEVLTSAVVDSASSLDSGTDRLLEWLPPEGIADINSMPATYFDPFLGIGGSSLKINTGNGTKLKTKNGGINFGLSSYLPNSHGMLIIAPVADYGQDYYESTLPDANGTTGHGHTKYFTAGFIARQVSTHGMYYETSLRYGQVRTNFLSNNFLVHNVPTTASYSASTPCYSGHVRIGWRNNISPQNILDVYGVYSLNRVNGFTTTVTSGEDYAFSAVKSGRIRLGVRLTREVKEKHSFYSGLSYIHEFTGDTVGEYMGMTTKRAGLKGNTGLIELGYQMKPSKNSVTMLDAGLTWWFGDQKGVTFAAKFKRDF